MREWKGASWRMGMTLVLPVLVSATLPASCSGDSSGPIGVGTASAAPASTTQRDNIPDQDGGLQRKVKFKVSTIT